jgi:hypothetical protein
VIIADMRSSMVAVKFAAAIGCGFDFVFLLAQRADIGRGRFDPVDSARSA